MSNHKTQKKQQLFEYGETEYGETDKSPVALHRWSHNHHIDWESSNSIDREDRLFMAIASSPAGPVLAGPAVMVILELCMRK